MRNSTSHLQRLFCLGAFLLLVAAPPLASAQLDAPAAAVHQDCTDPATADPACVSSQIVIPAAASGARLAMLPEDAPHTAGSIEADGSSPAAPLRPTPAAPPTEFQLMVQGDVGSMLPIFGTSLFSGVPTTFAPNNVAPVGADYMIGPGDEILLRVWGSISFNRELEVDRAGDIYLPQAGAVHVAGLHFSQVDSYLRTQLSPVFRNFDLSVNMGQLRSIQVFVVGQAQRPGTYTISSLSTLMNALFATGGPSPRGSMRRIQVVREDQVVTTFDLYDLLLDGRQTSNIRLLNGDVIYIPPVGSLAAVAGSVNVPAIYELRGGETMQDLVRLAGGRSTVAAPTPLQVERSSASGSRYTLTVPQDAASMRAVVESADIIQIPSIALNFDHTVTLRGNVANPGRYAWRQGMRVSDLIPERQALETRGYWRQRIALGLPSPAYTPLAGAADNAAMSTELIQTVPAIDWKYAVVERTDPKTLTTSLVSFDLGDAVAAVDSPQNIALMPDDVVTIFSTSDIDVPQEQRVKYVHLDGEFVKAGVYSALPGETLRQLVARAGGLTPQAYLYASQFLRVSTQQQQQQRYDQYIDEMQRELEASAANDSSVATSPQGIVADEANRRSAEEMIGTMRRIHPSGRVVLDFTAESAGLNAIPDLPLEDGDRFLIPALPHTVNVFGAVYSQDAYEFVKQRNVGGYLRQAGGATRQADSSREFVIRANGVVLSRQYARPTLFSAGLNARPIYPGDSVVMPSAVNKRGVLRGLMDWSSVFSQFGLGVGALSLMGF